MATRSLELHFEPAYWVAEAQTLTTSSDVFSKPLAGHWIRNGSAGTRMGTQHMTSVCSWRLYRCATMLALKGGVVRSADGEELLTLKSSKVISDMEKITAQTLVLISFSRWKKGKESCFSVPSIMSTYTVT